MRDLGPFAISIRELPIHRTLEVPPTFIEEAIDGLPLREALGAPKPDPSAGAGHGEIDIYADGDHVFVSGQLRGHVVVACSRCVGPAKVGFDEPVRVTFMPAAELGKKTPPAKPEVKPAGTEAEATAKPGKSKPDAKSTDDEEDGLEVGGDELDLFPYDGDSVDLTPLIREHFVLAVPYAPLCREDCRGLCPQCGQDRNKIECACQPPGDPRFAALGSLKLPS